MEYSGAYVVVRRGATFRPNTATETRSIGGSGYRRFRLSAVPALERGWGLGGCLSHLGRVDGGQRRLLNR